MRTTLQDADGNPKYTNRLVHESSPYLVQHAHNPVDWYPWGEEAFTRARTEDKPVFLSIGYSTCHWCHVMEHESFDNEEIATFLNAHFISIKLDREQRPDLDEVYMTGVQMMTGQGGWPMSNFLTPDGKPFHAGTYYPPTNFLSLLQQISAVWQDRREEVLAQAEEVTTGISRFTAARSESREAVTELGLAAAHELLGRFDEVNGGFGGAPKFPNESQLLVLLEAWQRYRLDGALEALTLTLDKMSQGGICDQVAGGFHRYTVDAIWLVPHFEKMLYNQAQLTRVFSRAAGLTGNLSFRRVVEEMVAYVLRDMSDPAGAFYSATDADSEGEEGLFFVWTPAELRAVLDADDYELVRAIYNVTEHGNFEGRNILHRSESLPDYARANSLSLSDLTGRLDRIHQQLYAVREEREHPLRDEKVITAWNGMMITSLTHASIELDRADYLLAAERAANAVWDSAWSEPRQLLWRISYKGECSIPGNLEDYAYLSEALLTLYKATGEPRWLECGELIVRQMIAHFWDEAGGGFFFSRDLPDPGDGPLITRPKSPMDGAMASGNSVALHSLVLLHAANADFGIEQKITGTINAFAGLLKASPSAFSYFIVAAEEYQGGALGPVQFAGDGNIRVVCKRREGGATLDIHMGENWHINGQSVSDDSLIPTSVSAGDALVSFPGGEVFEGHLGIDITGLTRDIELRLQPCNNELCLAPETLRFVVT